LRMLFVQFNLLLYSSSMAGIHYQNTLSFDLADQS
jgi:hypothetical protein